MIITGPNMAGKSTYLRQVALTAIMAQTGSFVPADSARVGIVDKVFTRIGASDDLARGVSTFMAEMTETANILNNATDRSLVILDEVGRGTATGDGLAIAWAAVEHLHGGEAAVQTPRPSVQPLSNDRDSSFDIRHSTLGAMRPKTLFATHYHELADITRSLFHAANFSFSVRETRDTVLFLRKLKPGPADRSYGIAVAKLAGLPLPVIRRARQVLADFERSEAGGVLRLSGAAPADAALAADRPPDDPVLAELRDAELDRLSPLEALNLLARLQRAARERSEPDA
jgi:DNA mismatch repair protein MutS